MAFLPELGKEKTACIFGVSHMPGLTARQFPLSSFFGSLGKGYTPDNVVPVEMNAGQHLSRQTRYDGVRVGTAPSTAGYLFSVFAVFLLKSPRQYKWVL